MDVYFVFLDAKALREHPQSASCSSALVHTNLVLLLSSSSSCPSWHVFCHPSAHDNTLPASFLPVGVVLVLDQKLGFSTMTPFGNTPVPVVRVSWCAHSFADVW